MSDAQKPVAWSMTFTDECNLPRREVFWDEKRMRHHQEHNIMARQLTVNVTPLYAVIKGATTVITPPDGWEEAVERAEFFVAPEVAGFGGSAEFFARAIIDMDAKIKELK